MRRLLPALAFALVGCTPPVTQVTIPSISSMQGKSYEDMVSATALKAAIGSEQVDARIVLPEMKVAYVEEYGKAKNMTPEEMDYHRKKAVEEDTITCQLVLTAVSEAGATPSNWTYTLVDDQGKTATGKPLSEGTPRKRAVGSTGQKAYEQVAQVTFETAKDTPYQIGTAKKVTIKFAKSGGKSIDLNWMLPPDRVPPPPSASQPTPPPPAGAGVPPTAPR